MKIKIVGIDPALRNMGLAVAMYDIDTGEIEIESLSLVKTEGEAGKTVRKSSDDLRRAMVLHDALQKACAHAVVAVAEVPTGTQSARGAMSNGIAIGVLASCPVPLIEVSPREAKMTSVGVATATKDEMIAWAMHEFPKANWLVRKSKGAVVPIADNEHLADACAIIKAGIQTSQFRGMVALLRSAKISHP